MRRRLYAILLIIILVIMPLVVSSELLTPWSNEKLLSFLDHSNQETCILVNKMIATQGIKELSFYDHVDNEERYKNLHERPILKKSNPSGPFNRKNTFVILVDRDQPLAFDFEIEKIMKFESKKGQWQIKREKIKQLVVWLKPLEKEAFYLKRSETGFELKLDATQKCGAIIFEIREPNKRYQLELSLINKSKPLTIKKD